MVVESQHNYRLTQSYFEAKMLQDGFLLYLTDAAKGSGLGYELIDFIEGRMREAGYKFSYLETHDNLRAAIHIYEKMGYKEIERPREVVHSTMNRFFMKELATPKK